MAESLPSEKMVAKYKCSECDKKWKSLNSNGGLKQCLSCKGSFIEPYKKRPVKDKDLREKRKFGKFDCACGNNWASGNTWVGKWQKCRECDAEVMPKDIRPLKRGRYPLVQKPHLSEHCQRCIELGYNCRNYSPSEGASNIDFPDDQSIISEASTASSSSLSEDQRLSDGDLTPVASDEEDMASFLESKIKSMDINKKMAK